MSRYPFNLDLWCEISGGAITCQEVADFTGMHLRTLRGWQNNGVRRSVAIFTRLIERHSEARDYLEAEWRGWQADGGGLREWWGGSSRESKLAGAHLLIWRLNNEISQPRMAAIFGVSLSVVKTWEGGASPSGYGAMLIDVVAACDINSVILFEIMEDMNKERAHV